jgi:lysozyme
MVMKQGIDVSEFNGAIDWPKVKAAGIEYAWIRSSLGVDYSDPLFLSNARAARAAGLSIGLYHFSTLNNKNVIADATAEAVFFLSKLSTVEWSLPPALDLEQNKAELTPAQVLQWAELFRNIVETIYPYQKTVLYSYLNFLNAHLPLGIDMPLWLALYNNEANPVLPQGWDLKSASPARKLIAWQWTSKGKVNGIMGDVDLNRVYVDDLHTQPMGSISLA